MKNQILFFTVFLATFSAVYSQVDLEFGLRAYFPFENNVNDASGNGITGTPINISYAEGVSGQAAEFNGISSYVNNVGNNTTFKFLHDGTNNTFCVWLQRNSFTPNQKIISTTMGYNLPGVELPMYWRVVAYGIGRRFPWPVVYFNQGENYPNSTDWVHLLITYDNSLESDQLKIYINAEFVGSVSRQHPCQNVNQNRSMKFSRNQEVNDSYFDGMMDEMRFYDRVLNQEEIDALYAENSSLDIVSISATPSPSCSAEEVHLDAEVIGKNISYSWTSSPAGFASNLASPTYYPVISTTFILSVTDGITTDIDSVFLIVNSIPNANAGADQKIYIGYPPYSSQINATGGVSYHWNPEEGLDDPNIFNPIASPGNSIIYVVSVTDENGCTGTDDILVDVVDVRCGKKLNKVQVCKVPPGNPNHEHTICVSPNAVAKLLAKGSYLGPCYSEKISELVSDDSSDELVINIYPNPFAIKTTIKVVLPENDYYNIYITDMFGRVVYPIYQGTLSKGEHEFNWTVSDPNSVEDYKGLYFLNVSNSCNSHRFKLIHN